MPYVAPETRYDSMKYRRCGRSGLELPAVSLGLWHNFGGSATRESARAMLLAAFDAGITHFDLANNYGPPPGSAEESFGRIMASDLGPYRDEIVVSTKAGYLMWPGPYGDRGSRKYLIASLDASLRRMGVDYVDIFYHHRPDPATPLEETMGALADIVRQGKALYVGLSNYKAEDMARAADILSSLGTRLLICQSRYSMLERGFESDQCELLRERGIGAIAFSPLAQGLLTDRYLRGIPPGSRAAGPSVFLKPESVTPEKVEIARSLSAIAAERGQSLAQMALSWALRDEAMTSVIIGASSPGQILENAAAASNTAFAAAELERIDAIVGGA